MELAYIFLGWLLGTEWGSKWGSVKMGVKQKWGSSRNGGQVSY